MARGATAADTETVRSLMQSLPVELTRDEWNLRASSLASAEQDLQRLDTEKKAEMKKHSEKIKEKKEEIAKLTKAVANRSEEREVPCIEEKVHSKGVVQIVRTDTGEVVSSRGMEEGERQVVLDTIANQPHVHAARADVPEAASD